MLETELSVQGPRLLPKRRFGSATADRVSAPPQKKSDRGGQKIIPVHALSRDTAPLILILGATYMWQFNFTMRSLFSGENLWYPLITRPGETRSQYGRFGWDKNSFIRTGIRTPRSSSGKKKNPVTQGNWEITQMKVWKIINKYLKTKC